MINGFAVRHLNLFVFSISSKEHNEKFVRFHQDIFISATQKTHKTDKITEQKGKKKTLCS